MSNHVAPINVTVEIRLSALAKSRCINAELRIRQDVPDSCETQLGVTRTSRRAATQGAAEDPIATLLTAKLMLDWLKETEMVTCLEAAIARVIAEGKVRTYDTSGRRGDTDSPWRGGKDSTLDMAEAITDFANS